jgi:hypothetical protein
MVQPGEVVGMFERFNVNRDGVEKCAVKSCDTISTFMLTFPSVQVYFYLKIYIFLRIQKFGFSQLILDADNDDFFIAIIPNRLLLAGARTGRNPRLTRRHNGDKRPSLSQQKKYPFYKIV